MEGARDARGDLIVIDGARDARGDFALRVVVAKCMYKKPNVWSLYYRTEIVWFIIGFIVGAIIL